MKGKKGEAAILFNSQFESRVLFKHGKPIPPGSDSYSFSPYFKTAVVFEWIGEAAATFLEF
jgi:hypothetical protein